MNKLSVSNLSLTKVFSAILNEIIQDDCTGPLPRANNVCCTPLLPLQRPFETYSVKRGPELNFPFEVLVYISKFLETQQEKMDFLSLKKEWNSRLKTSARIKIVLTPSFLYASSTDQDQIYELANKNQLTIIKTPDFCTF